MITEQVNEDQEKERQADQKRKNLAREQQQALLLANADLIQSQKYQQQKELENEQRMEAHRRKQEVTEQKIKDVEDRKNKERLDKLEKLYVSQHEAMRATIKNDPTEQLMEKHIMEADLKALTNYLQKEKHHSDSVKSINASRQQLIDKRLMEKTIEKGHQKQEIEFMRTRNQELISVS